MHIRSQHNCCLRKVSDCHKKYTGDCITAVSARHTSSTARLGSLASPQPPAEKATAHKCTMCVFVNTLLGSQSQ